MILLLVVWEAVLRLDPPLQLMLARPTAIAATLVERHDILASAALATLEITLAGFVLSVIVGAGLALLIARFSLFERAAYPLVVLFQTVPKVALAPIFILWFGYNLSPKVMLIVVIAFFPVTLDMLAGLQSVDPGLVSLVSLTPELLAARLGLPTVGEPASRPDPTMAGEPDLLPDPPTVQQASDDEPAVARRSSPHRDVSRTCPVPRQRARGRGENECDARPCRL